MYLFSQHCCKAGQSYYSHFTYMLKPLNTIQLFPYHTSHFLLMISVKLLRLDYCQLSGSWSMIKAQRYYSNTSKKASLQTIGGRSEMQADSWTMCVSESGRNVFLKESCLDSAWKGFLEQSIMLVGLKAFRLGLSHSSKPPLFLKRQSKW